MGAYVPLTHAELANYADAFAAKDGEPAIGSAGERMILEINWLRSNIAAVLKFIGEPGNCRACNAPIWWLKKRDGAIPYTSLGLNHFADCPGRERFRK